MSAAQDSVSSINYVTGDATRPQGDGYKIIAHCCNNANAWGSGFVLALSKRWSRPEQEYRDWCERRGKEEFRQMLGAMLLVPVESDIAVANIIGQDGLRTSKDGSPPIRYEAIASGFSHIANYALAHPEKNVSVHAPRLGCGLAGGNWSEVEPLLEEHFILRGIPVTIYDLPT